MTELDDRVLPRVIDARSPAARRGARRSATWSAPAGRLQRVRGRRRSCAQPAVARAPRRGRCAPTDLALANEATPEQRRERRSSTATRIAQPKATSTRSAHDLDAFLAALDPLLADPVANRAALVAGIDGFVDDAVDAARARGRASACRRPAGASPTRWRRAQFAGAARAGARPRRALGRRGSDVRRPDRRVRRAAGRRRRRGAASSCCARAESSRLDRVSSRCRRPADAARRRSTGKRDAFAARRDAVRATCSTRPRRPFAACSPRRRRCCRSTAFDPRAVRRSRAAEDARRRVRRASSRGRSRGRATALAAGSRPRRPSSTRTTRPPPATGARRGAAGGGARRCSARTSGSSPSSRSRRPGRRVAERRRAASGGELFDFLDRRPPASTSRSTSGSTASRACATKLRAWERDRDARRRVRAARAGADAAPAAVPRRRPLARARVPAGHVLDTRPAALHRALRDAVRQDAARSAACCSTSGPRSIPGDDGATTGITFHYDRPEHRAAAGDAARHARRRASGAWQWDDLVGALHETLDLAKKRAVEPVHVRPHHLKGGYSCRHASCRWPRGRPCWQASPWPSP